MLCTFFLNKTFFIIFKYGTTALIWSARNGGKPKDLRTRTITQGDGCFFEVDERENIISLLISAGSSVDAVGMYSWTPLLVATRGNHIEAVNLILENSPNVNSVDRDGMTALAVACKEGYSEIAFKLLTAGAYTNLQVIYAS